MNPPNASSKPVPFPACYCLDLKLSHLSFSENQGPKTKNAFEASEDSIFRITGKSEDLWNTSDPERVAPAVAHRATSTIPAN
jgi:hypothetical protein